MAGRRTSSIPTESSPNFKLANSGKLSCGRKQPSPQRVTIAQGEEQDPDLTNPEAFKDLKLSQIVKEKNDFQIGHVCCHQKRGTKGDFQCETCSKQWTQQKNATKSSLQRSIRSRSNYNADLNNDDVMSEMQTLSVQKESHHGVDQEIAREFLTSQEKNRSNSKVQVIDMALKVKIIDWLSNEVRLLKPTPDNTQLIANFHQFCRTGVIFGDLINRLNGRNEIIKGMHRNPPKGNMSQIMANFNKIMDYFKEFPRFCSRYLWSQTEIIAGNQEIIWGFLDDIWHWAHQKISPYDPAAIVNQKKQQRKIPPSKTQMHQNMFKARANMHPEPREEKKKKPPLSSTINQTFGHSNDHFQTAGGARVPSHLELLKPRSILPLPTNMIYQKRCNSARGQQLQVVDFNPFASGNNLGGIIGPSNVTYGTFDQHRQL